MSEWRKDPVVERWVVIATERGKRPVDFKLIVEEKKDGDCPLCSGHEKDTPPEIMSFREPGTNKDMPGWWIRVVPNKFPALRVEGREGIQRQGIYQVRDGLGAHEVVVEVPEHVGNLDRQDEKQIEEIIWAWRERSLDLRKDKRLNYIQIFKNFGRTAGASLEHAHSQIIATPMIPTEIQAEIQGAIKYEQDTGRCVFCDMLNQELSEQKRVIVQSKDFVAFTPFASRFPFEVWILPCEHQHDFVNIRKDQIEDLARVLRILLRKLSLTLSDPPYNMVLHTSPVNITEVKQYHWHLEILPRLTIIAGFELGTGYYINPTPPELAAEFLCKASDS